MALDVAVLLALSYCAFQASRGRAIPTKLTATDVTPAPSSPVERPTFNRWPVAGGAHITLDTSDRNPRLLGPGGEVLCGFSPQELIHGSSLSRGGTCLLLLIVSKLSAEPDSETSGYHETGYYYDYVLRVRSNRAGEWRATSVLKAERGVLLGGTVSELGEVSDDGMVALLKICTVDQHTAVPTYRWTTLNLQIGCRSLNPGLQLQYGAGR